MQHRNLLHFLGCAALLFIS